MCQKGVNCDFHEASLMSGCQGGARTKKQTKQPGMPFTHCIAHKLELALLDSVKSDTNLEKLQSTLSAFATIIHQRRVEKYTKSQVI